MNQRTLFLKLAKSYVLESGAVVIPRRDNVRFLDEYDVNLRDVELLITSLTEKDFIDGPESDRDDRFKDWIVAEFAPLFRSHRLYLKISIKVDVKRCKCLSIKIFTHKGQ